MRLFVESNDIPGLPDCHIKRYRPGELLLATETAGQHFGIVAAGICKELILSADGKEQTISLLKPGSIFGEMTLLTMRRFTFEIEIVAISEVGVWLLDKRLFDDLFHNNIQFCNWVIRTMAAKEASAVTMLYSLSFHTTLVALADVLLSLEEGGASQLNITHTELAALVGRTRVSVTNALLTLQQRGAIHQEKKCIRLTNSCLLRQIRDQTARAVPERQEASL